MNTITIDSNIYNDAEAYAQKHNTSVKDMVEHFLANFLAIKGKKNKKMEVPPNIARWAGILKGVEEKRGEDDRLDYLLEKYK